MGELRSTFLKFDPILCKNVSNIKLRRIVVMGYVLGLISIAHIVFFSINVPSQPEHVVRWYELVVIIHTAVFLSRSHQTVLGLDPYKFIGKNTVEFIHPDDLEFLVKSWSKAIQDKKVTVLVYRFRHADGHWIWLESHFVPVINEKGENEKFIM